MLPITNKNIAFIHIPRTAGSYVNSYLASILHKKSYKILNSWQLLNRDWNKEELLSFLKPDIHLKYVHNHLENWKSETFYEYKKNNWFIFSFVRHPGDQLCSIYYYWKIYKEEFNLTLDEFIKESVLNPIINAIIPAFWRDLNFIAEFNHKNFKEFLKKYFNQDYVPEKIRLPSRSKGYSYYCKHKIISLETQKILKNSEQHKIFLEIKKRKIECE